MLSESEKAYLAKHLSFWKDLTKTQQELTAQNAFSATYPKGKRILGGSQECAGLILIKEGQLRAFITSPGGKEISLYRLLTYDVCILSASCMIKNMNFDINVEVEKDCEAIVVPTAFFNDLSEKNIVVKDFSLELISARFSEVMWVFDQYVFGSAAQRLAGFLLQQAQLDQTDELKVTHEFIANDLGTAREVVTRLLKHFARDEVVSLSRGTITLKNYEALEKLV